LEDWNAGMVEYWVLGNWKNFVLTFKGISQKMRTSFKNNIPLFHISIIPCVGLKHQATEISLDLNKLQKFRDVKSS